MTAHTMQFEGRKFCGGRSDHVMRGRLKRAQRALSHDSPAILVMVVTGADLGRATLQTGATLQAPVLPGTSSPSSSSSVA